MRSNHQGHAGEPKGSWLLFLILFFVIAFVVFGSLVKDRNTLYQVSVLDGLMKGDYDGKVSLGQIRRHGNFGLGTFDRLNGEAIELNGVFYQVDSSGKVRRMNSGLTSPFAMAVNFHPDLKFPISLNPDYSSLQKFIDNQLPTKNIPYAIKIEGKFSYIKTRSVPAQNKPYIIFEEVAKKQSVFEFRDIEGTLVGFRMPEYAKGVNIAGYHLHFLSRDKTKGGHVLECAVENAEASIDSISRLIIELPESPYFYNLDFSSADNEGLKYE